MADINSAVTFRPDIDGPSVPTYTILTGDYLRKLHISKQYGTQIVTWVAEGTDPLCVPIEDMEKLKETWVKQAESLYPGEGDHRVRLLDDEGNRIPIGSEVEHIIEEDQVALPDCVTPECEDYFWDLSGQKPEDVVNVEYVNCNGETITIQDYVRALGVSVYLCVSQGRIKANPNTAVPTGQSCRITTPTKPSNP